MAHRLQEATAGLSNQATWYQYGFGRPQGPTGNRAVTGEDIRVVANFILERAAIHPPEEPIDIVLFSRTRNRKILNEDELLGGATHLKRPARQVTVLMPILALPLKSIESRRHFAGNESWPARPAGPFGGDAPN